MSTKIKPMKLQEAISDFINNYDNHRRLICNGQYSKYDGKCKIGAFDNIVESLLSGYIAVKHCHETVRCIMPTCVEIYYHEEDSERIPSDAETYIQEIDTSLQNIYSGNKIPENLLVYDFIVYHRNKPFQESNTPLFKTQGVLNNHQSGIDIAFEFPAKQGGRNINIRASALIRGFVVCTGEITSDIFDERPDDRSTYIYDHLYPFTPILGDGMQICWVDNNSENKLEIRAIPRKNVFEYRMDDTWTKEIKKAPSQRRKSLDYAVKIVKDKTKSGKPIYVPDERPLRFYNTIFYQKGEPK